MACKTYQYKLKTRIRQARVFSRWAGCRRWTWNHILKNFLEPIARIRAEEKAVPENNGKATTKYPSTFDLNNLLPALKKQHLWLKQPPSQSLQQAISDLSDSLARVAAGGGFPKVKRKGKSTDSCRLPSQVFEMDQRNNRLWIAKFGWIKYFNSRLFEGTPKTLTLLRKGADWFASIQVELPESATPPVHPHASVEVGIDRGIVTFAALSDGQNIPSLSPLKAHLKELRIAQRSVSRKKKGGQNWRKAVKKVASIHAKVARIRKDFLHKASTDVAKTHGKVYLEMLNVSHMTASAKGTAEEPGNNVKAKSSLNRAILDQGWYTFECMLQYKSEERGGVFLKVPAAYTSRKCSSCSHTARENRRTQAAFECVLCGHIDNADTNAAKNVLKAGQALLGASPKGDNQPRQRRAHQPARRSTP